MSDSYTTNTKFEDGVGNDQECNLKKGETRTMKCQFSSVSLLPVFNE